MCWNLQDLADLATVAQAFFVVLALFYAAYQLREAARSRQLYATTQLLTEIGTPKIREARWYVLYELPRDFKFPDLDKDKKDMIGSVAVAYDRVGYMIFEKLMPGKALFDFHGQDIGLVWDKIQPFIKYCREEASPIRPKYCEHFRRLAKEWLPDMKKKYVDKSRPGGSAGQEHKSDG